MAARDLFQVGSSGICVFTRPLIPDIPWVPWFRSLYDPVDCMCVWGGAYCGNCGVVWRWGVARCGGVGWFVVLRCGGV